MSTPSSYQPGQVLTAAELNSSFDDKTDNTDAAITGGTVTGITLLEVIGTTASTSPTTGAATVAGGLGVAGAINAGGIISAQGQIVAANANDSTSANTGSVVVAGGVGIAKSVQVGGSVTVAGAVNTQTAAVNAPTDSTSPSTGAAVVAGGLGVAKSMYVGGNTNVAGNETVAGNSTITGTAQAGNVTIAPGGKLTYQDGSTQSTAGAVNGEFAIPTTGGTVTVSAANAAANSIFNVTGSLTANVIVILPAAPKVLTVANNTTNAGATAFTVTVQVVGQTPSAGVAQGKAATLYTDTTGAYATSAASGFQFSGVVSDGTGQTLDITTSGKIVYQTAAAITTKAPKANAYQAGTGFAIKNTSTGAAAIATQSGDSFVDASSVTSITTNPNDSFCFVSDGVNSWRPVWYSNLYQPQFSGGIKFADGTVQTTANSTTQPASQWYVVGPTDTVGSFADGDTAIRTSGFTAPFVEVIKNGLTLTRGQHYTLNADGIHINFTDPLINNNVDSDQVEVKTKGVYNPSSTYAPSLPWVTPAAGATFIPYVHVVGFAWLMARGAFLQAGTDYTEDATGFYLVGFAADGVEQYGIFNLNAVSIANALLANSPVIANGSLTYADGTVQSTAPIGRNRIINGDFRVQLRAFGTPPLNTVSYMLDRWYVYAVGAVGTVGPVAGNPNYAGTAGAQAYQGFYGRIQGAAGNTAANMGQRIEAANIADLASKVVTISASVIRTLGGIVSVGYYTPTATDNFTTTNGYNLIGQITVPPNNWKKMVFSFTLPVGASLGLQIEFGTGGTLGAGDFFAATDVQLEQGNIPNPIYERRPFQQEYALCQRYYSRTSFWCGGTANGAGAATGCSGNFPVTMRTTPAVTALNAGNSGAVGTTNNVAAMGTFAFNANSASTGTGGFIVSGTIGADAEL